MFIILRRLSVLFWGCENISRSVSTLAECGTRKSYKPMRRRKTSKWLRWGRLQILWKCLQWPSTLEFLFCREVAVVEKDTLPGCRRIWLRIGERLRFCQRNCLAWSAHDCLHGRGIRGCCPELHPCCYSRSLKWSAGHRTFLK